MAKKEALKKLPKVTETCPNIPSFDFNPNNGAPRIRKGEIVVAQKEKHGIPVYVTDGGRVIYVCSLDTFEAKIHGLAKRAVFEHHFPQAAGEVKKFKLKDLAKIAEDEAEEALAKAKADKEAAAKAAAAENK